MKKGTEACTIATNEAELREALEPQYTWYEKLFSPFRTLRIRLEDRVGVNAPTRSKIILFWLYPNY